MYCTVFEGYANVAGIDKSVMHIAVDIMIYSTVCISQETYIFILHVHCTLYSMHTKVVSSFAKQINGKPVLHTFSQSLVKLQ